MRELLQIFRIAKNVVAQLCSDCSSHEFSQKKFSITQIFQFNYPVFLL